jgi:hypothetical protein
MPIYLNRDREPTSGIDPCRHSPDTCARFRRGKGHPMQGRSGGAPTVDQGRDQIPRSDTGGIFRGRRRIDMPSI